jgi:hypothetical protein
MCPAPLVTLVINLLHWDATHCHAFFYLVFNYYFRTGGSATVTLTAYILDAVPDTSGNTSTAAFFRHRATRNAMLVVEGVHMSFLLRT